MGGWDGVKSCWGFVFLDFFLGLMSGFRDLWGAIGILKGLFSGFMGCYKDFTI